MVDDSAYTDEINFIPAAPGFDVLTPRGDTFDAVPVVAWALMHTDEGSVIAVPVTMLEPRSINDDSAVRQPNGEVVFCDRTWPTDTAWLAEIKADEENSVEAEVELSSKPGKVLALDTFRNKFRSEQ